MSHLDDLLAVFDLDEVGPGHFTGTNFSEGPGGSVVFGGQLLGQAVVAAERTLPDKEVKSLHTVFARSATPDQPIEIDVEEMHEGRAFGSVTVTIRQGERLCTRSIALLHAPDDDLLRHATALPPVTGPEGRTPNTPDSWWEIRMPEGVDINDPDAIGPAELDVWTRFNGRDEIDAATSAALLAYASDGFLIATAMRPHPGAGQALAHVSISTTVLSQTLTFHEPFDASRWLLLAHESPYAGRGRSYGRANVFTESGVLVASYVQENMVRAFAEGKAPAAGQRSAH